MALTVVTQGLWDSTTCPKKEFQATSEYANIWSFDSSVVEDSIILGYVAASEHNSLSSDKATYPTQTIYSKKSYFTVHYLTILWANNSGCVVKDMQLWLLRLWNHEFKSHLVYAWLRLSVCIVLWRYRSCDEPFLYPISQESYWMSNRFRFSGVSSEMGQATGPNT
jgi:hypothetical protein